MEVVQIEGRQRCWGNRSVMAAGGPDKSTDREELEKT